MKEKKEYNAADEKVVKVLEEKAKTERDQDLEDVKTLINTPAGIRFFRRMLAEAKVFHTSFTGNSQTFFFEGKRDLALMFLDDICEVAPERVAALMIKPADPDDVMEEIY